MTKSERHSSSVDKYELLNLFQQMRKMVTNCQFVDLNKKGQALVLRDKLPFIPPAYKWMPNSSSLPKFWNEWAFSGNTYLLCTHLKPTQLNLVSEITPNTWKLLIRLFSEVTKTLSFILRLSLMWKRWIKHLHSRFERTSSTPHSKKHCFKN